MLSIKNIASLKDLLLLNEVINILIEEQKPKGNFNLFS